jgi:hypothetical protein
MSAPVLSPAEQAEVDRFGVHDEEIIAAIEDRSDETPICRVVRPEPCSATATHAIVCRECGGQAGLACTVHVGVAERSTRPATHTPCGAHAPMRDLVRTVPL